MKEDEPMKLPLKQHMEESVYTIEDDVRKLLKKETAELYLAEAEKRLDYEVKALNQTTERAYHLLSALLVLLTGFGWTLASSQAPVLTALSIICITACTLCIIILMRNLFSVHLVWSSGRTPREMDINSFIRYYDEEKLTDRQYINCLADELEAIEMKMALNQKNSERRTRSFQFCLHIMAGTLILCSAILVVSSLA